MPSCSANAEALSPLAFHFFTRFAQSLRVAMTSGPS
jgi:hypothetical protein